MNYSKNNIILGTILAVVGVIAYVVIAVTLPNDAVKIQNLILFVTPFITALLIADPLSQIKRDTDTISKNTNGVLSQHIDEVANRAAQRAAEYMQPTETEQTIESELTHG